MIDELSEYVHEMYGDAIMRAKNHGRECLMCKDSRTEICQLGLQLIAELREAAAATTELYEEF